MQRLSCGLALSGSVFLAGCIAMSMTPSQFNESFPKAANSKFYDSQSSKEAIARGECKVLVEGRKYVSPQGSTVDGDVKNAALGVDEWVKADNGNAYSIRNFEWIPVGDVSGTQLTVHFDTMHCK